VVLDEGVDVRLTGLAARERRLGGEQVPLLQVHTRRSSQAEMVEAGRELAELTTSKWETVKDTWSTPAKVTISTLCRAAGAPVTPQRLDEAMRCGNS